MSEWVALFLLVFAGIIVVLLIQRQLRIADFARKSKRTDPNRELDISRLIADLVEPKRRDQSRNRLLSLGPQVIPELLAQLIYHRFHIEPSTPKLIAEIEALVMDFGPSAVPPIVSRLAQWSPTHRCAPSFVRMCRQLGLDTLHTFFDTKGPGSRALEQLSRFLPHLLVNRADIRTCPLFVSGPQRAPAPALLVSLQSREWATLWLRLCASGQHALLLWLRDWPLCIDTSFLEFLLLQAEDEQLSDVLRLVALKPDSRLRNLVGEYRRHGSLKIRHDAVRTLALFDEPTISIDELLTMAEESDEALPAVLSYMALKMKRPEHRTQLQSLTRTWIEKLDSVDNGLADCLLSLLCDASRPLPPSSRLALSLVYPLLESNPSVAFERLLALSSTGSACSRAMAVLSLALHEDTRAVEAYSRCIQQPLAADLNFFLQQAAKQIGAPIARRIAGQLVAKGHGAPTFDRARLIRPDGHLFLAQLRTIPFDAAADILLELIENDTKTPIIHSLVLTLKAGNEIIRDYCAQALKQPERGLIMPTVRYLSFCPDQTLSDELLELVADFDLVRNQVLTLIEYLDDIGLLALDRAIDKGGMDNELDVLLETREWLTHCLDRKSA